jgi:hypothetical protein
MSGDVLKRVVLGTRNDFDDYINIPCRPHIGGREIGDQPVTSSSIAGTMP